MTARPDRTPRGFTLLEVLVAISILGLGLTMILSSQVGLFSGASRGQHLTIATNLARCKMSEIEVDLLKKGYQVTDQKDEGSCCGDDGEPGYHCEWKIERIVLPEQSPVTMDGGSSDLGGPLAALEKLSVGPLNPTGNSASSPGGNPLQSLTESMGPEGLSGITSMAMGMVYPSLKPMLEASIRKVTVTVTWKEGIKKRELPITQYVTSPQIGITADGGIAGLPGMTGAGTGLPGAGLTGFGLPGTGTGTTSTSPLGGIRR